jgi:3-isopropylmalate dehydrogenase
MPLLKKFNHEITWTPALTGACAIDAVGVPYPDATHEICLADAVLFGAVGHPNTIMTQLLQYGLNKDCY